MQRFNEAFGEVDLFVVTGDHVAHWAEPEVGQINPVRCLEMKENLAGTAAIVRDHFPNTPVIFNIGNNDDRFHYQAASESVKDDYYSFLWRTWFQEFPANSGFANDLNLETFMYAGYYRVDVTDKLSWLALNSMYWNKKNDKSA